MDHLKKLENRSIYIIREAYAQFRDTALLWSTGKDSTIMVWLARKAFFGSIPFPVLFIDTGSMFNEMYEFREHYKKEWNLNLLIAKNQTAFEKDYGPENFSDKEECCATLKTKALLDIREKNNLKALIFGIRGDDPGFGDKTASIIQTNDHFRIHPMLHWTVIDTWQYIKKEKIPIVNLYFAIRGQRYNTIGCAPCCRPVSSHADTPGKIIHELQRAKNTNPGGTELREGEDAYTIQKLKSLGYM